MSGQFHFAGNAFKAILGDDLIDPFREIPRTADPKALEFFLGTPNHPDYRPDYDHDLDEDEEIDAWNDIRLTHDDSPLGYRLLRKRRLRCWERLNVIVNDEPQAPLTPIPYEVMRALMGNRAIDISATQSKGWPFDLVIDDEGLMGLHGCDTPSLRNTILSYGGTQPAWLQRNLLITRRGGRRGAFESVSNNDDRDLQLPRNRKFSIGDLLDTRVDPMIYDLHISL